MKALHILLVEDEAIVAMLFADEGREMLSAR